MTWPKYLLTHWGWVMHICVCNLTTIGSDNGLSPDRRQANIYTNAEILLIGPLGTNFSEIFNRNSNIFIEENEFQNIVCEMLSISSRPQCVKDLINWQPSSHSPELNTTQWIQVRIIMLLNSHWRSLSNLAK